jgi:CheY-like chemotaxis protein
MDTEWGRSRHEKLLKRHGYDVVTATHEGEGFSVLRKDPVDAVILDFEAPGIGHGAVVRRMKDIKPHVPVLLVYASANTPRFPAADAVVLKADAPARLPGILDNLLNVRFPFFTRWFGNWKHRDLVRSR